jgi:DNA invertase Pin-like site-specific DNA recombinase
MPDGKFIQYARVSTTRQGISGLGLEAQRQAVTEWLNGGNWKLLAEFTEIESGKRNDRPQLAAALAMCRQTGATLVIAKLDRLTRNVAFLAELMDSGVKFVAVDNPHASKLTIHILAAVAEDERDRISARTKAALAAARSRGTKLGWSMPSRKDEQRVACERAARLNSERAIAFSDNVLPIVGSIKATGITTLKGIAAALNARGIRTSRGNNWRPGTVQRLLQRQFSAN